MFIILCIDDLHFVTIFIKKGTNNNNNNDNNTNNNNSGTLPKISYKEKYKDITGKKATKSCSTNTEMQPQLVWD